MLYIYYCYTYTYADDLEKLIFSMDKEKFEANDVIIRQGNKGNNFYILIDGEVAVYKNKINKSTKNGVEVEEGLSGTDADDWSNGHNYDQVATLKAGNDTYAYNACILRGCVHALF